MWKRLGKLAALGGFLLVLAGISGLCAYLAFGFSVRRGGVPAPDVLGMTLEESGALVETAGLRLRHRENEDRFDEATPVGRILQQDPSPGSSMKRGGVVSVVLSRGQQLVTAPDLRGKAMQAVQTELAAAGLLPGRTTRVYWPEGEPNTVVAQEPAAGTEISRGAEVEMLVAIGDPSAVYVMPDLVYRRAAEVRERFERAGFRFGSVKYEPYEGVEEGTVLRHTPLPGHPLRRHDAITMVVATRVPG